MALIVRQFNGKMNTDVSPFLLPPADYIDALNITRDAQGDGRDEVVSNIVGNQKVLYSLPAGTNKVIGSKADALRNRIYYFIWNSYGQNLWLYYDKTNDTITKILEDLVDTGGVAVLGFNPSNKINHYEIIYRDEEGDLHFWTDGNTTPKCANVQTILNGTYGTIKSAFIELAKMPPLAPPTGVYGNDTTKTANALRRKLFQFSYRWGYDDFQKSTFSAYSKIALPVGIYGSDNDLDNSNNNFITITVETGDANVSIIEIAMRNNIDDAWSDFSLIVTLDKAQLNIPDNSTYQFLFYNDQLYPPITDGVQYVDGVQVISLFDWCPQLADCLVLANGNTPVLGAITEGYDNYPVNQLNVILTAANQANTPPDTDPPQITYVQAANTFTFTVTGSVPVGTRYRIYIFFNGNPAIGQTYGVRLVADYTSILGDTINSVATALYNQFNSYPSVPIIIGSHAANYWNSTFGTAGNYVQQINITAGSSGGSISSEKTWMWGAQYVFGLVYFDEQNRDMPGVITFSNPTNSDNDFVVSTPYFSQSGGVPQTPVISASINHLPPAGAKKYCWVRRRQTYGSFLMYMTCDFQDDPDGDGYLYFCLANIDAYKTANSQFIYGAAPVTSESRLMVIAGITSSAYNGNIWNDDYQILGTVVKTLTGGSSPDDDRSFIKVKKPIGAISPSYSDNMLVMVYTPMANPISAADSVYWEWGETYDIYLDNGVYYHKGGTQNQTASQPALFTFIEGDVYYRQRPMFTSIVGEPPYTDIQTVDLMDANYSDYFNSAVNDNGRAHVIEINARQQFNPTLVRFALAYQSGTNINGVNTFYFENFDEYNRAWGNIVKLFIDRYVMYVFQTFNTGVVPVLQQVVFDTAGNPLQANSDILLNKIQYPYDKQFGLGNVPESFAFGKTAMYGIDNNKGIVWRLTPENGMQPLSVIYQTNAYFVAQLAAYKSDLNNGNPPKGGVYTGNPTCYGVFDTYTNKYIIALEEVNRYNSQGYPTFHQNAATVVFLETRGASEGFETFTSYYPEWLESLNTLLVTFKNGEFWKHNNNTYCNFYGIQYPCYIEAVFNDVVLEKKTFQSVTQISTTILSCPVIYTNVMSYGNTKQESELIEQDFTVFEQYPSASFYRDKNSIGGLINGEQLKGGWIAVRFYKQDASSLVILSGASVKFVDSPLTAK